MGATNSVKYASDGAKHASCGCVYMRYVEHEQKLHIVDRERICFVWCLIADTPRQKFCWRRTVHLFPSMADTWT